MKINKKTLLILMIAFFIYGCTDEVPEEVKTEWEKKIPHPKTMEIDLGMFKYTDTIVIPNHVPISKLGFLTEENFEFVQDYIKKNISESIIKELEYPSSLYKFSREKKFGHDVDGSIYWSNEYNGNYISCRGSELKTSGNAYWQAFITNDTLVNFMYFDGESWIEEENDDIRAAGFWTFYDPEFQNANPPHKTFRIEWEMYKNYSFTLKLTDLRNENTNDCYGNSMLYFSQSNLSNTELTDVLLFDLFDPVLNPYNLTYDTAFVFTNFCSDTENVSSEQFLVEWNLVITTAGAWGSPGKALLQYKENNNTEFLDEQYCWNYQVASTNTPAAFIDASCE